MTGSEGLEPPPETNIADPGAGQLSESSDDEDRFTDAQSVPVSPQPNSPIPTTRVEKVDNEPSHGQVPGTQAYEQRSEDAQPDEIAVLPPDDDATPLAGRFHTEVPLTIVREAPGPGPRSPPPEAEAKRVADAEPDAIVQAPSEEEEEQEQEREGEGVEEQGREEEEEEVAEEAKEDADDFADDFDDFEEGAENDDFDDFDDGFQQPTPLASAQPPPEQQPPKPASLPFPIPDFAGLSTEEIISRAEPYLDALFPPEDLECPEPPPLPKDMSLFMTPRAAPLWSQLVAPPPLAPPDWIRSRTRRLFLVSLGVPVDLDEILPASKQKKLILPSLRSSSVSSARSPRASGDDNQRRHSESRLRKGGEANASSTSLDTQGRATGPTTRTARRGPQPQPDLDLVAARHLCTTTDEALNGMTAEELKEHVAKLESMQGAAKELLEYWQKRTDEKIGDREAFEGVIENLVKHARKVRK